MDKASHNRWKRRGEPPVALDNLGVMRAGTIRSARIQSSAKHSNNSMSKHLCNACELP